MGEKPIWNLKTSNLTIPGRSVTIQLKRGNFRVYTKLTPYQVDLKKGKLLLLAQVWFSEAPDNKLKFINDFKSIPVLFGEKIHFYPLGLSDIAVNEKYYNIELEIQIVPYRESLAGVAE